MPRTMEVSNDKGISVALDASDSPNTNKKRKIISPLSPGPRCAKIKKTTNKENKSDCDTENEDIEVVKETRNNLSPLPVKKETPKSQKKSEKRTKDQKSPVNSLTKFFKKIENQAKENCKSNKNEPELIEIDMEKTEEQVVKAIEESEETIEPKAEKVTESFERSEEKVNETPKMKLEGEKCQVFDIDEDSNGSGEEKVIETPDESNESAAEKMTETPEESNAPETSKTDVKGNDESSDEDSSCNESSPDESDSEDKKLPPTTPKVAGRKNTPSTTSGRKLTPKQQEKKLASQQKAIERERQKFEREKKLHLEREKKMREKEEKKREREEKAKALLEAKKKEKEEKDLKRQAEIEQKQKEKDAKDEDRRKKEEEKKKKEEEKLEAERKKQKAASSFVNFFKKATIEAKPVEKPKVEEVRHFMPFEIKPDMRMAPVVRRKLSEADKKAIDALVAKEELEVGKLYLKVLKSKDYDIKKTDQTWPYEGKDVIIIEDEEEENESVVQLVGKTKEKRRKKLFSFDENRRPPYWRTWSKRSKRINPRRPFGKDEDLLDYEYDSDEDWEQEEEGESIQGSDDDKDKDEENEEDDYEVDNEFFVPHGYLSDEEAKDDEEIDESMSEDKETQKIKLKILGEQFEAERNAKTLKIRPKILGCVWMNSERKYAEDTPSFIKQFMTSREAWVREIPLILTAPADGEVSGEGFTTPQGRSKVLMSAEKTKLLQQIIPEIIRLLHGNMHNRAFLVKEFQAWWSETRQDTFPFSKAKMSQTIKELATWTACPDEGPMLGKHCWYVSQELRVKYNVLDKAVLPNTWTYKTTPKKRIVDTIEKIEKVKCGDKVEEKVEKDPVTRITQFTKVISQEERKKQLLEKPSVSPSVCKKVSPLNRQPKRVALISLPRCDAQAVKSPRVNLIGQFFSGGDKPKDAPKNAEDDDDNDDDCCMIIDD